MAKDRYKIPASLERSYWDHEISLSTKNTTVKPFPLKLIGWFGFVIVATLFALMSTFIGSAPIPIILLFLIWVGWVAAYFGNLTKTREMKFSFIPAYLGYAPKGNRNVVTRQSSPPKGMYMIVGIENITEDGLIEYADGTFGRAFLVVGSASTLLFDEDRRAIIDRVEAFWRKTRPGVEYIWMTLKEPQRTHHQIAAFQRRAANLKYKDPDLMDILEEEFDIMKDFVGTRFKSIHQYLIIKADSMEELALSVNMLAGEVETSTNMFQSCTRLLEDEVLDMLRVIYQGQTTLRVRRKQASRSRLAIRAGDSAGGAEPSVAAA